MSPPDSGWLKILLEKMQTDIDEMKNDIKVLMEDRATRNGMTYVIIGLASGAITIAFNLLSMWLKS